MKRHWLTLAYNRRTVIGRYCSGKSVIPPLVWREVERIAAAVR